MDILDFPLQTLDAWGPLSWEKTVAWGGLF